MRGTMCRADYMWEWHCITTPWSTTAGFHDRLLHITFCDWTYRNLAIVCLQSFKDCVQTF